MADEMVEVPYIGPPRGELAMRAGPRRVSRRLAVEGIDPARLSSVIRKLEDGDLEEWADLCEYIVRDPHTRGVLETRDSGVSGAQLGAEPVKSAADPVLAEEAAHAVREEIANCDDFEGVIDGLLFAESVGWALGEHCWELRDGWWRSTPSIIEARDVRFRADWAPQVRTYAAPNHTVGKWIDLAPHPAKFILHAPRKRGLPATRCGDFLAVAWWWLFKRWDVIWRQDSMERFADPFRVGSLPPNCPPAVRERFEEILENASSSHWAVIEQPGTIEYIERSSGEAGDPHTQAIHDLDDEITKAILGSTLNTDVSTAGGNRALGESQSQTTIIPRLKKISARLCTTLRAQWFGPYLRFNAHHFGGRIPPTPLLHFVLTQQQAQPVSQLTVAVGGATINEVRAGDGLQAWPAEQGGNRVAAVPQTQSPLPVPKAATRKRKAKQLDIFEE